MTEVGPGCRLAVATLRAAIDEEQHLTRPRGRPRRDDYVGPSEAAAIINDALGWTISSRTISRLYDSGRLSGHRTPLGGHRRILRDSVETFITEES